jgi:hypothetical protein
MRRCTKFLKNHFLGFVHFEPHNNITSTTLPCNYYNPRDLEVHINRERYILSILSDQFLHFFAKTKLILRVIATGLGWAGDR